MRKKEVKSVPAMLPMVERAYSAPTVVPLDDNRRMSSLAEQGLTAPKRALGAKNRNVESSSAPVRGSRSRLKIASDTVL